MNWQKISSLDWVAEFHQLYAKLPVAAINKFFAAALVVVLAWLLATASWLLVPANTSSLASTTVTSQAANAPAVNLDTVLSAGLFGVFQDKPKEAPVQTVTDAPPTSLNFKLTGVVAVAKKPEQGSAVIENNGVEQAYSVDEQIEGSSAVLKQVLDDRVILQVNGRMETLMLDGIEYQQLTEQNSGYQEGALVELPENEGPAVDQINDMRREIMNEPTKFFDYVNISPRNRNGHQYGYALLPGRDPAVFAAMGLLPNDVAIEINGVRLDDMQQAYAVFNELKEASQASIKIERDGEIQDIQVTLSR